MAAATPRRIDPQTRLKSAGGGGTYDGMEARVAKLEANVEHISAEVAKLSGLPVAVAEVRTRVDHLPDKEWIGAKLRNWIAGGVGVVTLVTIAAKYIQIG